MLKLEAWQYFGSKFCKGKILPKLSAWRAKENNVINWLLPILFHIPEFFSTRKINLWHIIKGRCPYNVNIKSGLFDPPSPLWTNNRLTNEIFVSFVIPAETFPNFFSQNPTVWAPLDPSGPQASKWCILSRPGGHRVQWGHRGDAEVTLSFMFQSPTNRCLRTPLAPSNQYLTLWADSGSLGHWVSQGCAEVTWSFLFQSPTKWVSKDSPGSKQSGFDILSWLSTPGHRGCVEVTWPFQDTEGVWRSLGLFVSKPHNMGVYELPWPPNNQDLKFWADSGPLWHWGHQGFGEVTWSFLFQNPSIWVSTDSTGPKIRIWHFELTWDP